MKRAFAAFLLLALPLHAQDWKKQLSPPQPGAFAQMRPFHAHYTFGWSALSAAEANFDFQTLKGGKGQMEVTAKTVGVVRPIWRFDTKHTALLDLATLRPLTVRQKAVYSDETINTKLDFTSAEVTRFRSGSADKKPAKTKRFVFPDVRDLHSSLQWIRSQRLRQGETYRFVVYPESSAYVAEVTVVGREKLHLAAKDWNSIRLSLKIWGLSKDLKLAKYSKFRSASMWISDDDDRMLLKVSSEIFVGAVWAELDSIVYKK